MDETLAARLAAAGVDPGSETDPAVAWRKLFERFGLRATLIDRYELEAARLAIAVDDLSDEQRRKLSAEVLPVRYPGMELFGPDSGHPVEVVPYDDDWPIRFEEWRRAMRHRFDPEARIEHMGSTAVPGLDAKPVIDVQVAVPDVEDEASYVGPLESAGLPLRTREPTHRYFRPPPSEPRTFQVHVCRLDGPWERDHLLFRDHMRAFPEVREAYAALKRRLAARFQNDRVAYNEAKTGFILDVMERANAWGESIGWSVARSTDRSVTRLVGAILRHRGRVLLCHRRAGESLHPATWDLPGGHVAAGEAPTAAIARELDEELGVRLPMPPPWPWATLRSAGFELMVYLVDSWDGEPFNAATDEHDTIRWVSAHEVGDLKLADPSYTQLVRSSLSPALRV